MSTTFQYPYDDIGPEIIHLVYDAETGMRGVIVVDSSALGPVGGGTRMAPDVSIDEVASLARSMTYKFGILGLPRGGSKAGIWGDPAMAPDKKRAYVRAFGRHVRPLLVDNFVAVGPDMGITVTDVAEMYAGAGVHNERSGLFAQLVDGDPAGYHLTGYGVVVAMDAAMQARGRTLAGAKVAIEGFGQVGVGTARYAAKRGATVVAISTLEGAIYDPRGLDVGRLMQLRREHGDRCILEYGKDIERMAADQLYYLPADVIVPGARPWVIHEDNCAKITAPVVVSAGNITVTPRAREYLFQHDILSVPDFIANSGGAISSWVDFLAGNFEQALRTIDRLIGPIAADVLAESARIGKDPYTVAADRVHRRVKAANGTPRKSFAESKVEIRRMFEL